jgi:hypothetical protein
MKISYVEFPTPDNSKILGLPIAPADNMTSFPTLISFVCPSGVLYSTARALRSADEPFGDVERLSQMIRVTVEFMKTLKFGRST